MNPPAALVRHVAASLLLLVAASGSLASLTSAQVPDSILNEDPATLTAAPIPDRLHEIRVSRRVEQHLIVQRWAFPTLPGIAVAEFKQESSDRNRRDAEFLKQMRAINNRPTGFSKYCICLLLTHGDIKHNRFKPQLRRLNRLMEEPNAIC